MEHQYEMHWEKKDDYYSCIVNKLFWGKTLGGKEIPVGFFANSCTPPEAYEQEEARKKVEARIIKMFQEVCNAALSKRRGFPGNRGYFKLQKLRPYDGPL